MAVQDRLYTVQDIAQMPDNRDKFIELHNGIIVETPGASLPQSALSVWIGHVLWSFIMDRKIGGCVTGADGVIELNRYNTRLPDMAYLSPTTLQCQEPNSFVKGGPDLVMEIISPLFTPSDMQQRAGEYLSAGSRLVWLINVGSRTVDVYREGGERILVSGTGVLEGYDVLPGLKLPLETVFIPFQSA